MSISTQILSADIAIYNNLSQKLLEKMDSFSQLANLSQDEALGYTTYCRIVNLISVILSYPDVASDPLKFSSFHHLASSASIMAFNIIERKVTELVPRSDDPQSIVLKKESIAIGIIAMCSIAHLENFKTHTGLEIVVV